LETSTPVDIVALVLDCVAHLEPVIDEAFRLDGVGTLDEQVRLRVGQELESFKGIPSASYFRNIEETLESWTVTLSHEALELLADSQANLLVQGPHPVEPKRLVYHWFEMCDASPGRELRYRRRRGLNFVLPLYFTPDNESGSRNDFLGTRTRARRSSPSACEQGRLHRILRPREEKG